MIELSFSRFQLSMELPLFPQSGTFDEGTGLEFVMSGTQNFLQPGSGTANAVFAGVAMNVYQRPSTMVFVDTLVIPTTGTNALTVTLTQIPLSTAVVSASIGNVALTQSGSASATNVYSIGGTNNQTLTFNAAQGGATVTVIYRYNITVPQAELFVGDGVAGGFSPSTITGTVGLIQKGIVFVSNFDTSKFWGAGNISNITLASGGLFTIGGAGAAVPATVYQTPSTDIPFLGLYFKG
jgi:hypothetical protein